MDRISTLEQQITDSLSDVATATHADNTVIERLIRNAQAHNAPMDPPRRPAVWVRPVFAAAAVAAIAAGTVVLLNGTHHTTTPSTSTTTSTTATPAPSPSRSSLTTPKVEDRFHSLSCTVPTPAGWDRAFSPIIRPPGTSSFDLTSGLSILGISSGGTVLASSDIAPHGELVRVQPDGSTRVLYRLPATLAGQSTRHFGDGQIDNQWAVFDVIIGGGQGSVGAIDAVNLATGSLQVVRAASLGTLAIVSAPQLLHGHVYWSEVDNTGQGSVYDYNLSTQTRSTLDTGAVSSPQVIGGAVAWGRGAKGPNGTLVWHGTPDLPPRFHAEPGVSSTLLRDGTVYAWSGWQGTGATQQQVIYMATAGMNKPDVVYTPPPANGTATLLALTGPYVIFTNNTAILALDTRTGAATTLVPSQQPFTTAAAANGIIALNVLGSKGGAQLVTLRTDALTELHC